MALLRVDGTGHQELQGIKLHEGCIQKGSEAKKAEDRARSKGNKAASTDQTVQIECNTGRQEKDLRNKGKGR